MMNKYTYNQNDGYGSETEREAESGISILSIELSENQTVMIEDKLPQGIFNYHPVTSHTGKFLHKNNNMLTLVICSEIKGDSRHCFEYEDDEDISILFTENKCLFCFDARIKKIREADGSDGFEEFKIDVIPLTVPQKWQRREFYRMPLSTDIYYKITEPDKIKDIIGSGALKFDPDKSKEIKKIAGEGLLEKEMGYSKLTTVDLSAGGFRYHSKEDIKEKIILDCLIIINDEAVPATAQILSSKPDFQYPDLYDVRALFEEISDPARDRVVRYIFAQERQNYSKLKNKKM